MSEETKKRIDEIENILAVLSEPFRRYFIKTIYDELLLLYKDLPEKIQLELDEWNKSFRFKIFHPVRIPAETNNLEAWAFANWLNELERLIARPPHDPELKLNRPFGKNWLKKNGPIDMYWLESAPVELPGRAGDLLPCTVYIDERGEVVVEMKFGFPKEKENE